jgi:starvation-inducible DNA-binding protein
MSIEDARKRREAPLDTPSNLGSNATKDISAALTVLLADVFALYVKTKNFHWHISGPHFREYHLLLDEQAAQIFAMTDDIAERARKIGGTTIRSIGHIARVKHIEDNGADFVTAEDMLAELKEDNLALTQRMRQTRMSATSTAMSPRPA